MVMIFRLFRNVVFLGWLCFALASTTLAATVWAVQLTATVATVSAQAAAAAVAHRRQLARAIARTKAKARLRRMIAAVPIAGLGAIAYFEERDFQDWKEDNPEGTRAEYACELAELSAEVIDEVLQDLPESVRPSPDNVQGWLPDCE